MLISNIYLYPIRKNIVQTTAKVMALILAVFFRNGKKSSSVVIRV